MYSKSIVTKALFTKTEMNKERIINFLQNTKCVQKVLWLKLNLPRQKWIKNESLIFLKILAVFKKYCEKAVFTKTEMNKEQIINFLQNTRCVQKVLWLNVLFTKTEMNKERIINFPQNTTSV